MLSVEMLYFELVVTSSSLIVIFIFHNNKILVGDGFSANTSPHYFY